ncbi:MAG: hypothetical protein ACRC7N_19170 [Clostridium sp.]
MSKNTKRGIVSVLALIFWFSASWPVLSSSNETANAVPSKVIDRPEFV